jgi:hypothetical protein
MAWKAFYNGKERHARKIPSGEDAYCTECEGIMRPWKHNVSTHLKHIENMGGTTGAGDGHCSGGEGDDHSRWKGLAADTLEDEFSDIAAVDGFSEESKTDLIQEKGVSAPVSDKDRRVGDVVLTFADPDWQLQDGLIVEVQDQNKSKDLLLTSQDYIDQGFSVVWLYADDFSDGDGESPGECKLTEVDFRHRARRSAMKYALSEQRPRWFSWELTNSPYYISAKQSPRPFMMASQSISTDNHVPAELPDEYWSKKQREHWEQQKWLCRFPNQTHTTPKDHRLRAAVGNGTTTRVDATLKLSFILRSEQEYWRETAWSSRFRCSKYNLSESEDGMAEVYINEVKSELQDPEIDISITQWLGPQFWQNAYRTGITGDYTTVEKPSNPFSDIQCHVCGHFLHVTDASRKCEHCECLYDIRWNIETGRIDRSDVKEHISTDRASPDVDIGAVNNDTEPSEVEMPVICAVCGMTVQSLPCDNCGQVAWFRHAEEVSVHD